MSYINRSLIALTLLFSLSHSAKAEFSNGGFEGNPDLSGWTVTTNLNPGIITPFPAIADDLPFSQLDLQSGGTDVTSVVTATTETGTDGVLGTNASFRYPRFGTKAGVVNYNRSSNNVNTLSQTMTIGTNDVDPADGKAHVRFVALPVLQSGGHPADEQPYYFIQVENVTKSTVLYHTFKYAGEAGVPWQIYTSYYYTDWQYIDIAPGAGDLDVGDQIRLKVIAAGCSQGGHRGWVYVDGVGAFLPGLAAVATAASSINDNSDLTYTITYKNGGTGSAAHATVTQPIPDNTTFVSVNAPGASCTAPSVGAGTGNVVCDVGTVNPNASGSFTVTVHVNNGATGLVSNGSYYINATGVSSLIGPLAQTSITTGVTYADLGVTVTDSAAAVAWGSPVSYTATVTNHGPGAANGASFTDVIPGNLTGATWSCTASGGAACGTSSGTGDINTTITTLPSGGSVTYIIAANVVAGSGSGSVAHRVDISPPGGVTDNVTTNDYAIDTNAIGTLRTLTINKTAAAAGTVLSVPSAINCGTSCATTSANFLDGSSITLSAVADGLYTFAGWSGAGCSGTGTCSFTITGNTTVDVTYTGGPAPTATPVPTNTPNATITPVPTPIVTPSNGNGGDTTDRTPTITGGGVPGTTIRIYVDGHLVGSTTVGTDGKWQYTFADALPIGSNHVTATTVDDHGNESDPSIINVGISDAGSLDFDGDGSTDIAAWKHSGKFITYGVRGEAESSWKYYRVKGTFPAPGDYNGDGKWDASAVEVKGHNLQWNIPSGLEGAASKVTFGKSGDTIISGCKLLGTDKSSLGIFRERERRIFARELTGDTKGKGIILSVKDANLLGCSDVDGDKIDDLIFQVPGKKSKNDGILVINLFGKQHSYEDVGSFARGLVIRRVNDQLPLVATLRSTPSGRRTLELVAISGGFSFPKINLAKDSTVAAGVFIRQGGVAQPSLFWSDKNGQVTRQYIVDGATPDKLFKLPKELQLIRAQNFARSADFRN